MRNYLDFYIDGSWVPPVQARTLNAINPATEEVAGHISMGGASATALNVLAEAGSEARQSILARSAGSSPLASTLRAASRWARASARLMSGNTPNDKVRCLPE